jgi:hypothetical protein
MELNIFTTLSKYTNSPENTLTEAFVFTLQLLLKQSRTVALEIISKLCDIHLYDIQEDETIIISTQSSITEGRPDITITIGNHLCVFIEIKDTALLSPMQLEKYHNYLQSSGFAVTKLVLLTRSRSSGIDTTLTSDQYHHILWYQVYAWLEQAVVYDDISTYFLTSMMEYLESKGMVMKKVTWEYMQGVPALYHFRSMIEEALRDAAPQGKIRRTAGWEWFGFYLDNNFFVGIYLSSPLILIFANDGDREPTYRRELDLEQSLFFALTVDKQYQALVQFLQESLESASRSATDVLDDEDESEELPSGS